MTMLTDDERRFLEKYDTVKIGMIGYTGDSEELIQRNPDGGPSCAVLMALDEAYESGKLPRRYEIIYRPDRGLPEGNAKNVVDTYNELCDLGCTLITEIIG